MESFTEKIPNYYKYIKDELIPGYLQNYRVVEDEKIICYFSKFTIDMNELYEIYRFVNSLKLNVFKALFEDFKQCANNVLTFNDNKLGEKDKTVMIFSAFFYHYYMSFSYDVNNKFDDYFNIDFLKKCESFKFSVKSVTSFQAHAQKFYLTMKQEIKKLDYEKIKRYYKYYNSNIVKIEKPDKDISIDELGEINYFKKKIVSNILSTKQKLVDMVFEIKTKKELEKYPKDANFIATSLEKMNEMSKEYLINASTNPTQQQSQPTVSTFRKRVLSVVDKYEIDSNTKATVEQVAKKIDEEYLDQYLNSHRNLEHRVMNYLICYKIDFNSDFIKRVSGNNNISSNLSISFLVPVKELYNLVMELFFSISNLSFMTVDNFVEVSLKKGIPMKHATLLYIYVKGFMKLCVAEENAKEQMVDIMRVFDEKSFDWWEKSIRERIEQLTSQNS